MSLVGSCTKSGGVFLFYSANPDLARPNGSRKTIGPLRNQPLASAPLQRNSFCGRWPLRPLQATASRRCKVREGTGQWKGVGSPSFCERGPESEPEDPATTHRCSRRSPGAAGSRRPPKNSPSPVNRPGPKAGIGLPSATEAIETHRWFPTRRPRSAERIRPPIASVRPPRRSSTPACHSPRKDGRTARRPFNLAPAPLRSSGRAAEAAKPVRSRVSRLSTARKPRTAAKPRILWCPAARRP